MIVCDACGNSMQSHPPCYNDPLAPAPATVYTAPLTEVADRCES